MKIKFIKLKRIVFFEKIETEKLSYSKYMFCFDNSENLILYNFKNFYLAYSKVPINNFHFLILPHNPCSSYKSFPKELKNEIFLIHSLNFLIYIL